jgi:hypothetical protein
LYNLRAVPTGNWIQWDSIGLSVFTAPGFDFIR